MNAFYRDVFKMQPLQNGEDLLPRHREGFVPFIVRAGLTLDRVRAALDKYTWGLQLKHLPSGGACSLDALLVHHDRWPTADYGLLFRNRNCADAEYENISAKTIRKSAVKPMTLLERMLIELFISRLAGREPMSPDPFSVHLDNTAGECTICAGSLDKEGNVPVMGYHILGQAPYIYVGDASRSSAGAAIREVILLDD